MSDKRVIQLTIEITAQNSELEESMAKIKTILEKENLGDRPPEDGVARLHYQLRQQRLHLLKVVEEKHALMKDRDLYRLALESALAEYQIMTGKRFSNYYDEFIGEGIFYVP